MSRILCEYHKIITDEQARKRRGNHPTMIRQRRCNPKVNIIYILFIICGINFLIYVFIVSVKETECKISWAIKVNITWAMKINNRWHMFTRCYKCFEAFSINNIFFFWMVNQMRSVKWTAPMDARVRAVKTISAHIPYDITANFDN